MQLGDEDVAALKPLGTLTCLRLGASEGGGGAMAMVAVSDAALVAAAGLPALRRLQISGGWNLTDGGALEIKVNEMW